MQHLIVNFGGHTYAAGLSMQPEDVAAFAKRFEAVCCQHTIEEREVTPTIDMDAMINFSEINQFVFNDLRRMRPYGPNNEKPVFCTQKVYDYGTSKVVGREQEHIKLELVDSKSNIVMNGIAFGQSSQARYVKTKRAFDIVYTVEENTHKRGEVQLQLIIGTSGRMTWTEASGLIHTAQMDAEQYLDILKEYWGYESFRGIQEDIIRSIGEGRDTLGLMPTGGGKSICFQVPAIAMGGLCLVITPLISLMEDQVSQLRMRGIKAETIHGHGARRRRAYSR